MATIVGSSEESFYKCAFCVYRSRNGIEFVKHLFEAHSLHTNFLYQCGISSCTHLFITGNTFETFRSHCVRKHHGWQHEFVPTLEFIQEEGDPVSSPQRIVPVTDGTDGEATSHDYTSRQEDETSTRYLDSLNNDTEVGADEQLNFAVQKETVKTAAAKFILTLKEKYRLTQASLDYTINAVDKLLSMSSEVAEQSFDQRQYLSPFDDLKTEYQQTKYFKENFGVVEPLTCELGSSFKYQQVGAKRRLIEVPKTSQYVPLLPNLERLLNNESIYQEVTRSHKRTDHLISDFCDAEFYRSHPLFGDCDDECLKLQFILYYDEVEVTNPLGSQRGKHKLALFYYTLANIHPKHRSSLKTIQLIAVVRYPLLKEYGFEAVLKPFINDMNKLRKGCLLTINNEETVVKGAVLAMLADTQAAHSIGGFKIGVGFSLRKCRNCLATKDTMSVRFREDMFVLRDSVNYEYHCSLLTGVLCESDSVIYGINYKSTLNQLDNFNVGNGQLPQDVMHILLEGVLPYTIKAMLQSFVCEKRFFTIEILNQKISSFRYSRSESKNKPSQISSSMLTDDGTISQSASQMWNLSVYLPLMIGDLVPECNKEWECFILLLEILQICVSPIFSIDLVDYLKVLIELYLSSFCECYPHKNIRPKQHYMTHFCSQILKFGPLTTSWCMRMEAKNSYFKRIAQQGNFKNIALSVARRHQKLICALLQSEDFFDKTLDKSNAEYHSSLEAEPNWIKQPIQDYLMHRSLQEFTVSRVDWIQWQGNQYCIDDVIWCGQKDELPRFGQLIGILIVKSSVFFALNFFKTKGINRHYNSILIEKLPAKFHLELLTEDHQWIGKQHSLVTHSLGSCTPGTYHVVMKYFLTDLVC